MKQQVYLQIKQVENTLWFNFNINMEGKKIVRKTAESWQYVLLVIYQTVLLNQFYTNLCYEHKQFIMPIFIFFSVRLLSVLHGHSFFSSPPQRPMTSDFEGFSIPDFIHYLYFPILILDSWKMPIDLLIKLYDQNKTLTLQSSKCFTSSVSNTSCQDSRMRVTFN